MLMLLSDAFVMPRSRAEVERFIHRPIWDFVHGSVFVKNMSGVRKGALDLDRGDPGRVESGFQPYWRLEIVIN